MALLRFDQFQEQRLYGARGFYMSGGAAGAGGDFFTAPELGNEFARALGAALDTRWNLLGRPNPFVVVEGGAGVGTLALGCLQLPLDCRECLRWVMVEVSEAQRETAMQRLMGELTVDGVDANAPVAAISDLSRARFDHDVHFVVANELLDNLPVRIVRRVDGVVEELFVEVGVSLAETVWRVADGGATTRALHHGAGVADGVEFPLADRMALWVHQAIELVGVGGEVTIMDYGATTAELAQRPNRGWLRTYDRHRRGSDPFDLDHLVDITCDVPFDQLQRGATYMTQREWVLRHRPQASDRNDAGTVALLDQNGVGGFTVATWVRR